MTKAKPLTGLAFVLYWEKATEITSLDGD